MTDMVYRLILKAEFEDEAQLQKALQGINQLELHEANITVGIGTMAKRSKIGLESVARATLRCGFTANMLESSFMRSEMAQLMVTRSQYQYNEIVKKYGRNSEQAKRAMKELELQRSYLNHATMRANISTGLMTLQFALQSGILEKAVLVQMLSTLRTIAETIWTGIEIIILKAKLAAMTLLTGGLCIPAMLAAGMAIEAAIGFDINIEREFHVETDVKDFLTARNRQTSSDLRRMRG